MGNAVAPKYLLNATPVVMGGGLQASVAFILEAMADVSINWHFLISPEVSEQLNRCSTSVTSEKFTVIDSPAKDRQIRMRILEMVLEHQPHAVFTFFGPAYVKLPVPHLMGVADGWITHSSRVAMHSKKDLRAWVRFALLFVYKRYWYRQADRWVVEADCAKQGMIKRFFLKSQDIDIVSNSCSAAFNANYNYTPKLGKRVRILFISSYYAHKNFEIIPYVAKALKLLCPEIAIEFVITIEKGSSDERRLLDSAAAFGVSEYLVNMGPTPVVEAPGLYRDCHMVFMPSLLETFSAIYPEAMISGLPIVTADLDFARNICQDAALYYSPLDASSAARSIAKLLMNPKLYQDLQQKGRLRVKAFPTQSKKYMAYCESISRLADKEGVGK